MSNIPPPPPKKDGGNAKLAALGGLTKAPERPAKAPKPITASADDDLKPLNFKVSPEFKRRFKMYAIENDTTMVELMVSTMTKLMDDN